MYLWINIQYTLGVIQENKIGIPYLVTQVTELPNVRVYNIIFYT